MADTRFFKKSQSYSIAEIAKITQAEISAGGTSSLMLRDVSPLQDAQDDQLSFLDNIKYKEDFKTTSAGACFVSPKMLEHAPDGLTCLVTENPYKAYALSAQAFYPHTVLTGKAHISDSAYIDKNAKIGDGCYIGPNTYIGPNVEIGSNSHIDVNASILDGVSIGKNTKVGANASISHSLIGDFVNIYPGARIGQDGFGFAIDPQGHVKVPQLGRVLIKDHVEIGANTTIDRGAGPDTIIGQGTWIDNLVQIGHNVVIGRGCVIVAQVGISGSATIEDYVVIGGQAGIAGHITIETGVRIGAQSGVMSTLKSGKEYLGSPAVPKNDFFKQVAMLNRLIKKKKKV